MIKFIPITGNDAYANTAHYDVQRNYTTNGLNQYVSAGPSSFAYDPNGNLTSDGAVSFTYDVENRLIEASGARNAEIIYDPLGRLWEVNQGSSATTTNFLYDGDALIAEYDGLGNMLRRYVHGGGVDQPLLWYEGDQTDSASQRGLFANHQGSIAAVADSTGNPIAINGYDSYGIPNETNIGRFQYTGQIWLPELGLYYYKARIYSPTLGRFLQTDPIGYEDQYNLYAYVGNDPVNLIDPSGGRTEENDVSGRRVVITTDRRAGHVQKRHNPRPGGASNIDYFRRTQSKSDIKTLAGRVVSAAINNGAIVSEGDQIIYEAEIGNIITNFFAPLGSEGQTFARVVAQPLPSLKDPNVSKEVAAELAQLAPEIAANIANDNQGDEPVEVLFVFTVYPIQESERKTTDYE